MTKTHAEFFEEVKNILDEAASIVYRTQAYSCIADEINKAIELIERFKAEQNDDNDPPFLKTITEIKLYEELEKHRDFLNKLMESIKIYTYKDYFRDNVVDPEKIIEEIEEFQAEQKVSDE